MSADFTPPLKPYNDINKFRFWCQKVLPLVYDDSLSYYELLNKVVDYLNRVIDNMDNVEDNVKSLYDAFIELQNYVNQYFDSQDWQSMVNNKIDQLVIDGYFEEIIEPLVTEDFNRLVTELNNFKQEVNTDIGEFKREVNNDIQTQNDDIAVLEARMDTFASLPDGSTAGDAELLDIRVGADGITYPSAGDAVRAQDNELKSALSHVITPLNLYIKATCEDNYGIKGEDGTKVANNDYWITDYIEVESNFIVSNDEMYKIAYYDANKAYVSLGSEQLTNFSTIPVTAKYAIVQFKKTTVSYGDDNVILICSKIKTISSHTNKYQFNKSGTYLNIVQNDFEDNFGKYIASVGGTVQISYEQGTINGSNGEDSPSALRVRGVGYIPIEAFFRYYNPYIYETILFVYDEKQTYLGRCTNGFRPQYFTRTEALAIYPTAKYFRVLFDTSSVETAEQTMIFSSESAYKAYMSYTQMFRQGYAYYGNKISLRENFCNYHQLPYTGAGQDGTVANGRFFACSTNGIIYAYNIEDFNVPVIQINLQNKDTIKPHCNSAVWGNKYDNDDAYPLLYINAYNTVGLPNGTCYVHRITDTDGVPDNTTEMIQTISIGFADEEPWTDGNDVRPYGNFFVDTDGGFLWAYTLKDAINKTRFFKFALPDVSESTVTLTINDIIDQFDVDYMPYIQGNTYLCGKAYVLNGFGTSNLKGELNVVNLINKTIESKVILNDIGLAIEPEFINIVSGKIVLGQTTAYEFDF